MMTMRIWILNYVYALISSKDCVKKANNVNFHMIFPLNLRRLIFTLIKDHNSQINSRMKTLRIGERIKLNRSQRLMKENIKTKNQPKLFVNFILTPQKKGYMVGTGNNILNFKYIKSIKFYDFFYNKNKGCVLME